MLITEMSFFVKLSLLSCDWLWPPILVPPKPLDPGYAHGERPLTQCSDIGMGHLGIWDT